MYVFDIILYLDRQLIAHIMQTALVYEGASISIINTLLSMFEKFTSAALKLDFYGIKFQNIKIRVIKISHIICRKTFCYFFLQQNKVFSDGLNLFYRNF